MSFIPIALLFSVCNQAKHTRHMHIRVHNTTDYSPIVQPDQ